MRCLQSLAIVVVIAAATPVLAQTHLRHVGRYNTHYDDYRDHLMAVEHVGEHHALVSSWLDIALVDLEALSETGTDELLVRCEGVDVTSTITIDDTIVYANLRLGGVAILDLQIDPPSLEVVTTLGEDGVYFDRMFIDADLLYVSAHTGGLRIYDRSDPWAPVLIGSLDEGLTDAFAVAVDGDLAYVADGAGGLKIVDVADPTAPALIAGETVETSIGTSSDVLVHAGNVYVAAGGGGVTFYPAGDLAGRVIVDTPVSAKQIELLGERLVVADMGGIEVMSIGPGGTPVPIARESGRRRVLDEAERTVSLRFWHGVGTWGPNRVLAANWDAMDVYEIVESSEVADVTPSTQQIRFAPGGGSATIELSSTGGVPLQISSVEAPQGFAASAGQTIVPPGSTTPLQITYSGGPPGAGLVLVHTNDPDESPLPIEVYGETEYLDPGEPAQPFTLPSWRFDRDQDEFVTGIFDLEACAGRIVYFHVFGVW